MGMVGQKALGIFHALNVAGPILGKELRVSSHQKRYFALRSIYVAVFMISTLIAWYAIADPQLINRTYTLARMSHVGLELMIFVGVFQFFALQLISPVLTCTAISDEITKGTLGTLLTTPITSLQIVLGKFLSKTLIMILLVGITLPFLATLRVFGGIEWNLIAWLTALTLSAAIFNATLGLVLSIHFRRAYLTILLSYLSLAGVFLLAPLMLALSTGFHDDWFMVFNPYVCLVELIEHSYSPGRRWKGLMWPGWQCLMLLGTSVGLLLFSSGVVRRKALALAAGSEGTEPDENPGRQRGRKTRNVTNRPVLWRELHVPLFKRNSWRVITLLVLGFVLVWIYAFSIDESNDHDYHVAFTFVYLLLAYLVAAVFPGTTLTHEKESGSWEVLLASPLTGGQIVWGKALGVLRRILPVSVLFFGHIILFTLAGNIHPLALVYMAPLLIGPVIFLTGTGIMFGALVKRTTTVVMLNIGLGLLLWGGLPLLAAGLEEIPPRHFRGLLDHVMYLNPMGLDVIIFDELGKGARLNWPGPIQFWFIRGDHVGVTTFSWFFSMVIGGYLVTGLLALWLAARRIRRIRG